jgi:OFA family oxalate/formate antiporter-like MFS transporter
VLRRAIALGDRLKVVRPDFPFRPASLPFFYGWVVLGASTLGIAMSIPGQTMGISVFTDHLIEVCGLSRLELSNAYLVGTVVSGLLLPAGGTLVDRFGPRRVVFVVCAALGGVLVYLANSDAIAGSLSAAIPSISPAAFAWVVLMLGFTGVRLTGQGMLTLCSRTMMAHWFERRRGLAAAIQGPFVSFSFAGAPLLLSLWIERAGWRGAWFEMAIVIGIGMAGLGWLLFRDGPEECGLRMDGAPPAEVEGATQSSATGVKRRVIRDFTRSEALRTGAFWLLALGIGNQAMVGTGITFHIVDIGAEAGMGERAAVAIFLPVAVMSTIVGIAAGAAIDRFPTRYLIMLMMLGQSGMFAGMAHFGDPSLRLVTVASWGLASGFFGPLMAAAVPNFFGRTHIGAIQGVLMMVLVIASALGPSALALFKNAFGSYAPGLTVLAAMPLLVFVAAPFTRDPQSAVRRDE